MRKSADAMPLRRNWLFPLGVLGGALSPCGPAAWLWTAAGTACVAVLLARSRRMRFLVLFLLGLAAGLLSVRLADNLPDDHIARLLRHHARGAEARFRITDREALGESAPEEETNAPLTLTAELLAIKFDHENRWRPASGKVQLRGADGFRLDELADGEIVECSGRFFPPGPQVRHFLHRRNGSSAAPQFDANSFDTYRRARGIAASFQAVTCRKSRPETSSPGAVWRRTLLEKIGRGIDRPERRALLGALTLGMRSQLPPELKLEFRQAGIAHLFSVSGLHVGVLAMLLLLLLRPLPVFWRTAALTTLILYVWITGGNAPAIRAFLLVLLLGMVRSRLYWLRALEVLALIGAGLLLWNPAFLFDAGFQYSFVITGFLILAAQSSGGIAAAARGPIDWRPDASGLTKRLCRWRGAFAAALFIAVTASLSGAMLSLHHQHYFFPGAWLVNLLLLPILSPVFLLATAKCLLPWLNVFWNGLLNPALDYLEGVLRLARIWEGGSTFLIPGWGAVILYGVLLTLALRHPDRRLRFASFLGVLSMLFFYALAGGAVPPAAAIVTGGNAQVPVIALLHPASREMSVYNATGEGVYPLINLAEHYRIRKINLMVLAPNRTETLRGLPILRGRFPVREVFLPEAGIRSNAFRDRLREVALHAGATDHAELHWEAQKDCWTLRSDGRPAARVRVERSAAGPWQVTVNETRFAIPSGSVPRVDLVELR